MVGGSHGVWEKGAHGFAWPTETFSSTHYLCANQFGFPHNVVFFSKLIRGDLNCWMIVERVTKTKWNGLLFDPSFLNVQIIIHKELRLIIKDQLFSL